MSAFLLGTGHSQRADDVGAARAGAGQCSPLLQAASKPVVAFLAPLLWILQHDTAGLVSCGKGMPPCVTLQTPKPVGDPGLTGNLQWLEISAACLRPAAGPQPSQSLCGAVELPGWQGSFPPPPFPAPDASRCTRIPRCSAPWLHSTPRVVARHPALSPSQAIPRPSLHRLARGNLLRGCTSEANHLPFPLPLPSSATSSYGARHRKVPVSFGAAILQTIPADKQLEGTQTPTKPTL